MALKYRYSRFRKTPNHMMGAMITKAAAPAAIHPVIDPISMSGSSSYFYRHTGAGNRLFKINIGWKRKISHPGGRQLIH
jgi:hypothetical protein